MALNNVVDREIDSLNPRTSNRPLPSGEIKLWEAVALIVASYALLFYSAYRLNPLCLLLSPLVPLTAFVYPYCKRFTSASHLVLGVNLGYAPLGGWLAVTGTLPAGMELLGFVSIFIAVTLWVAGFDVIYSLQDLDFDRKHGFYSIPSVFGVETALKLSTIFHLAMLAALYTVYLFLGLGRVFLAGLLVVSALVYYEHKIVTPQNFRMVPIAFFNVNAAISLTLLLATAGDLLLQG